jgi:hypothetical protein
MLTHWFIVIFGNSGDGYGLKGPATILRRHRSEAPAEFPAADDQAAAARPIILVSGARHEREIVSTRADTAPAYSRCDGVRARLYLWSKTALPDRVGQVRSGLTAGAKRIRTLGPTRVRHPRQPQGSSPTPRLEGDGFELFVPGHESAECRSASGVAGSSRTGEGDVGGGLHHRYRRPVAPRLCGVCVGHRCDRPRPVPGVDAPAALRHP